MCGMRVKAAQDCGDAHGKRTAATVRAPELYSNTSWFVFSICIFFFKFHTNVQFKLCNQSKKT